MIKGEAKTCNAYINQIEKDAEIIHIYGKILI
jgi:hypothetical protein